MVTTNFKVQKRKISQIDSVPYTGEYNIDTFKFEFDEEWEGLDKTLVFISGNNRYNIALLNDEALMPFEMYQIKGNIQIGLFGTDNGLRTLATGWLPLYIEEDSYEVSVEPENLPTPTQWDMYVTEINRLLDECQASQEQCELIQAQIEEDYEQYLADLNQIKSDTLGYKNDTQALKNETNQIKNDVIGLKNQVESDIADAELRISEYNANAQTKTNQFNQNATEKTNAFNDNASSKTTSFNSNYTEKLGLINTAGSTQVGNVQNAGTTQIGLVNTAGETAVGNVQSAEDTAIENIEEAGESYDVRINQLLDQIPVGTAEGESINVQDSANLPIKDILIKGNTSQDGTPTPSEPVDVEVVTGDVIVNAVNKNLFNKGVNDVKSLNSGTSTSAGSSFTFSAASNQKHIYIECEPNTTYAITKSVSQVSVLGVYETTQIPAVGVSGKILYFSSSSNGKVVVTTSGSAKYLDIRLNTNAISSEVLESIVESIQVEKNSVVTDYEPYQGKSQLLSLGNIELCKIGDYQDYLWRDNSSEKWYKHKVIQKLQLTSVSSVAKSGSTYRGIVNLTSQNKTTKTRPALSNRYEKGETSSQTGRFDVNVDGLQWYFNVPAEEITTKEDFDTWLSTNDVYYYFVLNTPIEEEITDTTLLSQLNALYELQTFKNVTNMYTTTQNEVPILNVTYRKDLQTLTDKIALLDARLSLLE